MRHWISIGAFAVAALSAVAAWAGPSVQFRGAAVRVVVIPEARRDVAVMVLRNARGLPLKIRRAGDRVTITGTVARGIRGCVVVGKRQYVRIWNRGDTVVEALPQIVLRTPTSVRISAGDAVFGSVGRSGSLDLTNQGCGTWTVADVAGRMHVDQTGPGTIRTGTALVADLNVALAGVLQTQGITRGVTAVSSGDGEITVAAMNGPLDARVAGAGAIRIKAGEASTLAASIAGSGEIEFAGKAGSLNATIAGSGHVRVAAVAGGVKKQVYGAGDISIGR